MKNPFWVIRSFFCILYHFLSSIPPYPSFLSLSISLFLPQSVSVLGRASCDSYGNKSSLSHPIPILGQERYVNAYFFATRRF